MMQETKISRGGSVFFRRSFIFIEDCVDGVLRLLFSDLAEPINLGSDELISMNDFATMVALAQLRLPKVKENCFYICPIFESGQVNKKNS